MRSSTRGSLLAAAAIAMMGAGMAQAVAGPTLRSAGSGNNRRPTPPRRDTEQDREVAAWNEAVERRKAEKKAAKLSKRVA